jgi:hypothetical protein
MSAAVLDGSVAGGYVSLRAGLPLGSSPCEVVLREMIGFATERLMTLEADQLCGVASGERTP